LLTAVTGWSYREFAVSHKQANTLTVGQLVVENLDELKAIDALKGGSADDSSQHRTNLSQGQIACIRNFDWDAASGGIMPFPAKTWGMYSWDPNSLGWLDTDMGDTPPPWIALYYVKPDDLSDSETGRWVSTIPLVMWFGWMEGMDAPSSTSAGTRLHMNPGKWYDNGDGLGPCTDANSLYTLRENTWYAVPFRVDYVTAFSAIATECTQLLSQGYISMAVYTNLGTSGVSGPDMYVPNSWTDGGVFVSDLGAVVHNYSTPLVLGPGWYWLGICTGYSGEGYQNSWRHFKKDFEGDYGGWINNNTAHLGYTSPTQLKSTQMVFTDSSGHNPSSPPPYTFSTDPLGQDDGYTETDAEPIRLLLKVAGTYDPSNPSGGGEFYGCTDPAAINHDPNATIDDGSCDYPTTAFIIGQGDTIYAPAGVLYDTGGESGNYGNDEMRQTSIAPDGGFTPAFYADGQSNHVAVYYSTETSVDTISLVLMRDGEEVNNWTFSGHESDNEVWLENGNPMPNFWSNDWYTNPPVFLRFPDYPNDWDPSQNVETLVVYFNADGSNTHKGFAVYWGDPYQTYTNSGYNPGESTGSISGGQGYSYTPSSGTTPEYYGATVNTVSVSNTYPTLLAVLAAQGIEVASEEEARNNYPELAAIYDTQNEALASETEEDGG